MADIADEAQDAMELAAELAMVKRKHISLPKGICLECEEPTVGSFCCKDCRDYYEIRERLQKIKGVACYD